MNDKDAGNLDESTTVNPASEEPSTPAVTPEQLRRSADALEHNTNGSTVATSIAPTLRAAADLIERLMREPATCTRGYYGSIHRCVTHDGAEMIGSTNRCIATRTAEDERADVVAYLSGCSAGPSEPPLTWAADNISRGDHAGSAKRASDPPTRRKLGSD